MCVSVCCLDLQASIPVMNACCAWLLLFVNIFLPGFGTMMMGLKACSCKCFFVGVLQFLLAPFIIGWVWAIYWSVIAIQIAI